MVRPLPQNPATWIGREMSIKADLRIDCRTNSQPCRKRALATSTCKNSKRSHQAVSPEWMLAASSTLTIARAPCCSWRARHNHEQTAAAAKSTDEVTASQRSALLSVSAPKTSPDPEPALSSPEPPMPEPYDPPEPRASTAPVSKSRPDA